ncbi:hypothetical protein BH18VER1_BH18VER1_14170 [soil metagenome]
MMANRSRVVLYIGVTNSLARRVWQHQHGEVAGFTKRDKVGQLGYPESFNRSGDAISREKELKAWRRSKKNELVETLNPKWDDLSAMLYQPARDPSSSSRFVMTTGHGALTQRINMSAKEAAQ